MSVQDHANKRFSDKAVVYNGRPEWPEFVYKLMIDKIGFNPFDKEQMKSLVAVDIGAGTGKTTFPLADLGCTVIAVEPNDEMLKELNARKAKGGYDNVIAVKGDAFNLNLPEEYKGKVDLFYCGNAAHWWGSRVAGNGKGQEQKAVKSWQEYAATDAQACIMYLRAAEENEHVIELRNILFKHFELTRTNPTEPCNMKLFEFSAFKGYFNSKALRPPQETYVPTEHALQSYEHFQQWLKSHSYFPNNGFENTAAEKDLKDFYDRAVERGNGTAEIPFGVRLYTGSLKESSIATKIKVLPADGIPQQVSDTQSVLISNNQVNAP